MQTSTKLNSYLSSGSIVDWNKLHNLIDEEHYEAIVDILHQAQIKRGLHNDELTMNIFVALAQISLACSYARDEVEWHKDAYEQAEERKQELERVLKSVFVLCDNLKQVEPDSTQTDKADALSPAAASAPEPQTARGFLLQSVKNLLSRKEIPHTSGYQQQPIIPQPPSPDEPTRHTGLVVHMLGNFEAFLCDQRIDDWPSRKGKLVFKYLVLHHDKRIRKDVLMELFWPEADADAARNNLNVTIYGLRQALRAYNPAFSTILFAEDSYFSNPELTVWIDVEQFITHYKLAQKIEHDKGMKHAVQAYCAAEVLYRGPFLQEDLYDDWIIDYRRQMQTTYLQLLDRLSLYYLEQKNYIACISTCNKMLAVDSCQETTHERLMLCHSLEGHRHLALRQFHTCVQALKQELDIAPNAQIVNLYEKIKMNQLAHEIPYPISVS